MAGWRSSARPAVTVKTWLVLRLRARMSQLPARLSSQTTMLLLVLGAPCSAVLVTDVERDGMMTGPNLELARRVGITSGIPALLSGGVHTLSDLEAARRIGLVIPRAIVEHAAEVVGN